MLRKVGKTVTAFLVVTFLLVVLFFISCNLGSLKVSAGELFRGLFVEYDKTVASIYDLRFPRIIVAMLGGAAFSVSGVLFQAVMKNPLADPTMIGVSSGASLASVLVATFFPSLYFSGPIFAFLGGVVAFFIVYSLSWKQGLRPIRIILVGIAVNAVFNGLIEGLSSMSPSQTSSVTSIINANISLKTWSDVRLLTGYVIVGLLAAFACSFFCDILALEDRTARSLGINVNVVRILVSLVAVLLASIATAVVGVIAFVGLVVPHIARLLVGSNHKVLLPFSALLGACLLLLADTLGRTLFMPYEINAAIIMSLVGGPFFIVLLRRNAKL